MSLSQQKALASLLSFRTTTIENPLAQRQLGYLWAIAHDAAVIVDLLPEYTLLREPPVALPVVDVTMIPNFEGSMMNVYPSLGCSNPSAWPRGLPVYTTGTAYIANASEMLKGTWHQKNVGVIASVIDGSADVDPLLDETSQHNISFGKAERLLVVPRKVFAPYNARSTFHSKTALWGLNFPLSLPPHTADIFRSYIAQRLFWDVGLNVLYGGPHFQQRKQRINRQSTEVPDHTKWAALIKVLKNWSSRKKTLPSRALELYKLLYKLNFIAVKDVGSLRSWFRGLQSLGYIFPQIVPERGLVVRSFAGDIDKLNKFLLPTMQMFLPTDVEVTFVLDDESPKDHKIGSCLESHGFRVIYEAFPNKNVVQFHGTAGGKKRGTGYDRQQWSHFYTDNYSSANLVGSIDSDAMFFSLLTESTIYDEKKKVICKAINRTIHYKNDGIALRMENVHAYMWIDRFPFWFQRETFQNARSYIAKQWGVSFDRAFDEFSRKKYSEWNIISHYAVYREPSHYTLRLTSSPKGTVSVAGQKGSREEAVTGCCQLFGVGCRSSIINATTHLLRYNHEETGWLRISAGAEAANEHYLQAAELIQSMQVQDFNSRVAACKLFQDSAYPSICSRPGHLQ